MVSRRTFLQGAVGALLASSCGHFLWAESAAAGGVGTSAVDRWLGSVQRLSTEVKQGRLSTRAWRRRLQQATRRVPLNDVLGLADIETAAASTDTGNVPEPQWTIALPRPDGLDGFAFTAILAHIREGYAVVPHGHHNMVSMHLVLRGALHLRQYDRLRDEPAHLVIRPVADRVCRPGDTTAISAVRGNVHWFRGLADSWALIIAAYDLDPTAGGTARDYVDPLAAARRPDGSLRVPRMTVDEAYQRYLRF